MWPAKLEHLPEYFQLEGSTRYILVRISPKDFWQHADIWSSVCPKLHILLTYDKPQVVIHRRPWNAELRWTSPVLIHWLKPHAPPHCSSHESQTKMVAMKNCLSELMRTIHTPTCVLVEQSSTYNSHEALNTSPNFFGKVSSTKKIDEHLVHDGGF